MHPTAHTGNVYRFALTSLTLMQVISAPISQYDVENGRSACTCICLEAAMQILRGYADGVWAGTSEIVTVSVSHRYIQQLWHVHFPQALLARVLGLRRSCCVPSSFLSSPCAAVAVRQHQHRRVRARTTCTPAFFVVA